jgi:lysophospholipase L1-like esterase
MKRFIVNFRHNLFIAFCLFAFADTGFAQTTTDTQPPAAPAKIPALYPKGVFDTTYRPATTAKIVAGFKANPITADDYVFLGNSITARCDWAKLFNEPHAKNRGISGDITFGVLDRLDEVIAGHPKKIFILIGINDISRNIPDSLIIRNHKRMVDRIRAGSPSTQIYFNTILPVNPSFKKFPNHYEKDEHILAINAAIKKLKAKNVTIIDLYPHFLDDQNHLKAEWTEDGLHPNELGYQAWLPIFEKGKYLK